MKAFQHSTISQKPWFFCVYLLDVLEHWLCFVVVLNLPEFAVVILPITLHIFLITLDYPNTYAQNLNQLLCVWFL